MKSRNGKIVGAVISMIIMCLFAYVIKIVAIEEAKEDIRYKFDSDYRSDIDNWEKSLWICPIVGVIELVWTLAKVSADDEDPTANLLKCPDCWGVVSRSVTHCPHCGRKMKVNALDNNRALRYGEWKCKCGRINQSYVTTCACGVAKKIGALNNKGNDMVKCPACGDEFSLARNFCPTCGEKVRH